MIDRVSGGYVKRTTKLRGKYIEDYTMEDIEELSREELSVFYVFIQLFLLDEIDDLVNGDNQLKQANDILLKFKR